MKLEWYTFEDKLPEMDDDIIIETIGFKDNKFRLIRTTLRTGEGLGSYKQWCYTKDYMHGRKDT